MKKVLVTLDINYPKEITDITFPYMEKYAKSIGAEFLIIKERKYPDLPITQEKFQLYDIDSDYTLFLDADVLIWPNSFDFSTLESNIIVFAEWLSGKDFSPESPPGKNKIRVHSAFLAFSKENKYLVKPHKNPLKYTHNILYEKNKEWHLDEYIMTINLLKHGANILTLKEDFTNTISHIANYDNYLTLDQKVKFLKEEVIKVKINEKLIGEYV